MTKLGITTGQTVNVDQTVMPFFNVCPICREKMRCTGETSTLVGYISSRGHNHDDNCKKRTYSCQNGHKITVSKINKCPVCDWVGEKECFCCPDGKIEEWPIEV